MRRLCYIASPSYSGSTLLTLLLNTHPGVATVGELKGRLYASREAPRRCSCGRDVEACSFWSAVGTRLARNAVEFDPRDLDTDFRAPGRPVVDALLRVRVRGHVFESLRRVGLRGWPGANRERFRLVGRNHALIEAICAQQGGPVLLDASKDATRLAFLIEAGLWDVRVIHLLRDGRGTAHSFRERDGIPVPRAAERWRSAHDAFGPLFARLGAEAVHVMRYEELASRPLETLADALDFLELPRDGASLSFRGREHHVFGNPMRFGACDRIRLDERWKSALSPGDLDAFERVAGARNREFGYAR
jgi:hypothetical protein